MKNLETRVQEIDAIRELVLKRLQSNLTKKADLRVIETSREEADTYKRLALLVKDDEWVVPYDLLR